MFKKIFLLIIIIISILLMTSCDNTIHAIRVDDETINIQNKNSFGQETYIWETFEK